MPASTNSLVATAKRFAVPVGAAAALLLGGAFFVGHNQVHAASSGGVLNTASPLDDSSVSSLVSLDNAVEAVASRVTPARSSCSAASAMRPRYAAPASARNISSCFRNAIGCITHSDQGLHRYVMLSVSF